MPKTYPLQSFIGSTFTTQWPGVIERLCEDGEWRYFATSRGWIAAFSDRYIDNGVNASGNHSVNVWTAKEQITLYVPREYMP